MFPKGTVFVCTVCGKEFPPTNYEVPDGIGVSCTCFSKCEVKDAVSITGTKGVLECEKAQDSTEVRKENAKG